MTEASMLRMADSDDEGKLPGTLAAVKDGGYLMVLLALLVGFLMGAFVVKRGPGIARGYRRVPDAATS